MGARGAGQHVTLCTGCDHGAAEQGPVAAPSQAWHQVQIRYPCPLPPTLLTEGGASRPQQAGWKAQLQPSQHSRSPPSLHL